uniref:Uncharacterized protein n=1 Tax=Romanomermis culicivorax TaxID=13658 RepID=A0A915L4E7_ROMCU
MGSPAGPSTYMGSPGIGTRPTQGIGAPSVYMGSPVGPSNYMGSPGVATTSAGQGMGGASAYMSQPKTTVQY